jgi:hypothetical protein
MPRLDNSSGDMEQFKVPGSFAFSGQKIDTLGASEFTIGAIAIDRSGSITGFKDILEKCLSNTVKVLKSPKNPRADNMMLRVTSFDSNLNEVHGFKALNNCDPNDYIGCVTPGGSTALFDATLEGVQTMLAYAEELVKQDFSVNGVIYILTDGCDNMSVNTVNAVRGALANAVQEEKLESLISVLIGVNIVNAEVKKHLEDFSKNAGFTQFISIEDATEKSLAKVSNFMVSQSVSQSQSLGSGGPSRSLSF